MQHALPAGRLCLCWAVSECRGGEVPAARTHIRSCDRRLRAPDERCREQSDRAPHVSGLMRARRRRAAHRATAVRAASERTKRTHALLSYGRERRRCRHGEASSSLGRLNGTGNMRNRSPKPERQFVPCARMGPPPPGADRHDIREFPAPAHRRVPATDLVENPVPRTRR